MNQGQFLSIYRELEKITALLQQLVDARALTLGFGALPVEPTTEEAPKEAKGAKRGAKLPE